MKIEFACPFCRKPHSVEPELAGRRGRCKDCGTVMRIPGERAAANLDKKATLREKPAARVAIPTRETLQPTPPEPVPRPRPRPEPVREPEPVLEVDDPYGLADELPAPTSRQGLVEAGVAEPEYAPLPRAGFEPSVTKPRRQGSGGAWWVSLRRIAMMLMGSAFYTVVKTRRLWSQTQTSGPWSTARWIFSLGIGIAILIAAVFTVVSLIGSAISFLRGDRRSNRCETRGQQIGWFATIVVTCLLCGLLLTAFFRPNRAGLGGLDARLSATEQADIRVYENLVGQATAFHGRLANTLATLPPPDRPGGLAAWQALGSIEAEVDRIKGEAAVTPKPTRGQVQQLFDRHGEEYRNALAATTQATHDVIARLNLPEDSEFEKILETLEASSVKYENEYKQAYPAGATDASGWYFALFGADVASRR